MNTKITAKDFFLHLGTIATFYASVIALITLLFAVINYAYPKVTNAFQYYTPSISLQVATLIVAFPLFLFLSWLLQKTYASDPSLRDAGIRKWLSYITLFVAGAILAGDLVTVIYMYLDGQELTKGFLLKVLTLLVIMSGVFAYYLREIRNMISGTERNIWRAVAVIVILGSIVLGFSVLGSPAAQREYRYDMERVTNLQNLQWGVVNYWQQKGILPNEISDLNDSIRGHYEVVDPVTGASYEYEKTGILSFRLCGTFARESHMSTGMDYSMAYPIDYMSPEGQNWAHPAGRHCFDRTIDPDLYPVMKR